MAETEKRKTTTSWQVKQKYNQKAYDEIKITVKKGRKEQLKDIATARGEKSLNSFINKAIDEKCEKLEANS